MRKKHGRSKREETELKNTIYNIKNVKGKNAYLIKFFSVSCLLIT